MGKTLFVTGTGTDVGKTALSLAVLLWAKSRGLKAGYLKPIQCGTFDFGTPPNPIDDAAWVRHFAGEDTGTHVTYRLRMAASPHLAAERENRTIDSQHIVTEIELQKSLFDLLLVEGSGGAAVPINRQGLTLASLAAKLSIPTLIAAAPGLGTLHHTLTTMAFLKAAQVPILGFVFSHRDLIVPETSADNRLTLESLSGIPCLGELHHCPELAKDSKAFSSKAHTWITDLARGLDKRWDTL